MPIIVRHVRVEDLSMDERWAIAGIHRRRDRAEIAARLLRNGHYVAVCQLDRDDPSVDNCQVAYALTQNVDRSWSRTPPPGLTPFEPSTEIDPGYAARRPYGRRSSMIGDVIEFGRMEGERFVPIRRFVVDVEGFTEIPRGNDDEIPVQG